MQLDFGKYEAVVTLLGAGVVFIGLLLLALALFRDRSRGRRRCPKCWYDMAGTPGLTCPECGRTSKRERSFFRTRRRWRWAAASSVVMLIGVGTAALPAVRHGWWAIVPTPILVRFVPPAAECTFFNPTAGTSGLIPVAKELQRRLENGNVSESTWRRLLERADVISIRDRWVRGVPEQAIVRSIPWLPSGTWITFGPSKVEEEDPDDVVAAYFAGLRPREMPRRVHLNAEHTTDGVVYHRLNVRIERAPMQSSTSTAPDLLVDYEVVKVMKYVEDAAAALTSKSGPKIDSEIRASLHLSLLEHYAEADFIQFVLTVHAQLPPLTSAAVDYSVELRRDNTAMTEFLTVTTSQYGGRVVKFRLRRADIEAPGKWTIHVRSTIPAFEDAWHKDYYWSGELVYDVTRHITIRDLREPVQ